MGLSSILTPWQWQSLTLSTLVKALLIPTYHSTDFEVHRHWLALTRSLPLSQWYFDETSQWTLDYPPFFAYFSWLLSIPAAWWDARIVDIEAGLEYDAWSCIIFMRLSVIITELVLCGALFALSNTSMNKHQTTSVLPASVASALLMHPGLIIVDHIHFQYNGFLFGILLWSVWAAREDRPLLCALLFSSLLNLKHIYIYIAPAYFVYLLQNYVIRGHSHGDDISRSGIGERMIALATVTLTPFALSVVPLAVSGLSSSAPAGPLGIIAQMLRRLFPFSRGLIHAYWAANAWALYTFADRVLAKVLHVAAVDSNATKGIIGDTHFAVLPQITAGHCFLLTIVCSIGICVRLWRHPSYTSFVFSIALFGLTSFLFGFHVHEKAILLAIVPLALLANQTFTLMRRSLVLTLSGCVGLFPLLYERRELPIKVLILVLWLLMTPFGSAFHMRFSSNYPHQPSPTNIDLLVHFGENLYMAGFVLVILFVEIVHPMFLDKGAASEASLVYAALSAASGVSHVFENATDCALPVSELNTMQQASESHSKSQPMAASTPFSTSEGNTTSQSAFLPSTSSSLDFLPLMLTSVYCALGVVWVWFTLYERFLRGAEERDRDDSLHEEKRFPHATRSTRT